MQSRSSSPRAARRSSRLRVVLGIATALTVLVTVHLIYSALQQHWRADTRFSEDFIKRTHRLERKPRLEGRADELQKLQRAVDARHAVPDDELEQQQRSKPGDHERLLAETQQRAALAEGRHQVAINSLLLLHDSKGEAGSWVDSADSMQHAASTQMASAAAERSPSAAAAEGLAIERQPHVLAAVMQFAAGTAAESADSSLAIRSALTGAGLPDSSSLPASPELQQAAHATPRAHLPPAADAEQQFVLLDRVAAALAGDAHEQLRLAQQQRQEAALRGRAQYHTIMTCNGALYVQWQARVMHFHYQKQRALDVEGAMGGFTRILHGGQPDAFMEEIPTFVAEPLPAGVDQGFVVLNRPYAVMQWAHGPGRDVPEDYVFMAEPDQLFLRPMPLMATPRSAAAFPFTYMNPQENAAVLAKYNPGDVPVAWIPPIGNSPTVLHKAALQEIVQPWYDISLRMKLDPDCNTAFGWILEMYAFAMATAQLSSGPLIVDLHPELQLQPPWDEGLAIHGVPAYLLHYTYGLDFREDGTSCYGEVGPHHWDKRDWTQQYPPSNWTWPPVVQHAAAVKQLELIREAAQHLRPWPDG